VRLARQADGGGDGLEHRADFDAIVIGADTTA